MRINSGCARFAEDELSSEVRVGERHVPLGVRLEGYYFHDTYHTGQTDLPQQIAGTSDKIIYPEMRLVLALIQVFSNSDINLTPCALNLLSIRLPGWKKTCVSAKRTLFNSSTVFLFRAIEFARSASSS
jgi:hypothetical protein